MSTFISTFLVPALVALLPGFVTSWVMSALKKLSTWINNLPSVAKVIVVIGIAFAVVEVKHLIGLALPTTLEGFIINALVVALVAFGAYELETRVFGSSSTPVTPAPTPTPTPPAAAKK